MKTLISMALAATLLTPALLAAEPLRLLPAAQGDLVATRLSQEKSAPSGDIERAPVDFAWALDPVAALAREAPFVADSREFWTLLDAAQLKRGHAFHTTAPGALVRLSPAAGAKNAGLRIDDIALRIDGKRLDAARAVSASVDAAQLKAAGADFSEGTLVFRLAPEAGIGKVELAADNASGSYLLHVFEPDSPVSLRLNADSDRALAGGSVKLSAQMTSDAKQLRPQRIGGLVTSPDGHSIEVDFTRTKRGDYEAVLELPADAGSGLALWEVHTFAVAKRGEALVPRDAKTSFSVSRPTARLGDEADAGIAKSGAVAIALPVEVASPGRYEVRGVLYGSSTDGSLQPFAIAHSARWLEPGHARIALDFGDLAAKSGLAAPYELRDVSLNDQARLGLLETRARALRIEASATR